MPRAPIWVGFGIGCVGEGSMNALTVLVGGRAVRGRADERVRELDAGPDLEQAGFHRRVDGRHLQAEDFAGRV